MVIPPERLIDGCVETLRDEVLPNLEARTEALAAAPSGSGSDRAAALRQALVAAIDTLYALPSGVPEAARRALGDHLGPQAVRDLAPLKPSLLNEISKG